MGIGANLPMLFLRRYHLMLLRLHRPKPGSMSPPNQRSNFMNSPHQTYQSLDVILVIGTTGSTRPLGGTFMGGYVHHHRRIVGIYLNE